MSGKIKLTDGRIRLDHRIKDNNPGLTIRSNDVTLSYHPKRDNYSDFRRREKERRKRYETKKSLEIDRLKTEKLQMKMMEAAIASENTKQSIAGGFENISETSLCIGTSDNTATNVMSSLNRCRKRKEKMKNERKRFEQLKSFKSFYCGTVETSSDSEC
ncbi:uncharacterized protein LOC106871400 [Octopus bimaculoides]|uniref:Uncharacterized protein n=1 Tax=Octopus bimaculoides TaxID=37653 RepID=A0A0L8IDY3_OCTBM|nr:uncharacterized protein LOC106871400 [Octopus bimaculoides]|eukprot:XP_014773311.1 PREDICTED: uncharacterized protein LOC106871400 [Octopus bimaculoides]